MNSIVSIIALAMVVGVSPVAVASDSTTTTTYAEGVPLTADERIVSGFASSAEAYAAAEFGDKWGYWARCQIIAFTIEPTSITSRPYDGVEAATKVLAQAAVSGCRANGVYHQQVLFDALVFRAANGNRYAQQHLWALMQPWLSIYKESMADAIRLEARVRLEGLLASDASDVGALLRLAAFHASTERATCINYLQRARDAGSDASSMFCQTAAAYSNHRESMSMAGINHLRHLLKS